MNKKVSRQRRIVKQPDVLQTRVAVNKEYEAIKSLAEELNQKISTLMRSEIEKIFSGEISIFTIKGIRTEHISGKSTPYSFKASITTIHQLQAMCKNAKISPSLFLRKLMIWIVRQAGGET